MTIKSLILLLFLYICLVWVGGAYLHSGPSIKEFGLRWTLFGLMAVFAFIVGAQFVGLWRRWRARAAARPKAAAKSGPAVHEDDAALAALIAEANTTLAKAPGYAPASTAPIYQLPWFLMIGPEGSGKTSTFLNSGVEPQLLAGHVMGSGSVVSTRVCNLWLAKNAIFAEVSGRLFNADVARWTQLLKVLRGGEDSRSWWKRLWGAPQKKLALRGVIAFSDVRELTGAAADPQRFERYCGKWQERLRAIGEVFGVERPVYQITTQCDRIPFFPEFFRQISEPETGQVFGCTLPFHRIDSSQTGEVFAEAEAKRLTRAFRLLYHSLAHRRLSHLAYETTSTRRPAIYEFPRELQRIRTPLVQFLTEAFRPNALMPGPLLRGYYLTGVCELETTAATRLTNPEDSISMDRRSFRAADATQMFEPGKFDATRMFGEQTIVNSERPKRTTRRWSFVSELLHRIILVDQPVPMTVPAAAGSEVYPRRVFVAVCGVCVLLCVAFLVSWNGNVSLLNDVQAAADAPFQQQGSVTTVVDLRRLDALRFEVERLRQGAGWSLHWGLYSGNTLLDETRAGYFKRFRQLLLNDLNQKMVNQLRTVPAVPRSEDPYDPIYRTLKTHLMITGGACPVEPVLISQVLKEKRNDIASRDALEWQTLADRQIEFYASELVYGNPSPLPEDVAAWKDARQYLRNITGVDKLYNGILANAEKTLTRPVRLADRAPDYSQVLRGEDQMSVAYTPEGWNFLEKASKEPGKNALGEPCVFGAEAEAPASLPPDAAAEQAIKKLFVRDYIQRWQKFVTGFSIVPFSSPQDAVRKLDILSSNRSPLLAVLAVTANQTNFAEPEPLPLPQSVQSLIKRAEKAINPDGETPAKSAEPIGNPTDITRFFQPVHWVVKPNSETLVGERNAAYMDALANLRGSMNDIANSTDPAVYQVAGQNYEKALDAVRQIARGFRPDELGIAVQQLLEQPIRQTERFIDTDVVKRGTEQINAKLRALCTSLKGTFEKYPFRQSSRDDASLDEFSRGFGPSGEIWKFQGQVLADMVVKDGGRWRSKDPAQKPQVTQEMLAFLNRAELLGAAFYAGGRTQPQLAYTLRPKLDSSFKDSILELEADGQLHQWTSVLQKQFTWPAAAGARAGAIARIRTTVAYAFASRGGLWGIFRVMGDAEPRALSAPVVEWKYSRGSDGGLDPIQPAPVRMEFAEFPGDVDVFNPQFFAGLQCPVRAAQ